MADNDLGNNGAWDKMTQEWSLGGWEESAGHGFNKKKKKEEGTGGFGFGLKRKNKTRGGLQEH